MVNAPHSMAAGHRVALPPQVFREFLFHGHRDIEGHGIVNFVKFRQEPNAELRDDRRRFESALMIGKAFFRFKASHADVNTGLGGIAVGIGATQFAGSRGCTIQQHDVNAVMMRRVGARFDLAEGAASHIQRRFRENYRQAQLLHKGGVEREVAPDPNLGRAEV